MFLSQTRRLKSFILTFCQREKEIVRDRTIQKNWARLHPSAVGRDAFHACGSSEGSPSTVHQAAINRVAACPSLYPCVRSSSPLRTQRLLLDCSSARIRGGQWISRWPTVGGAKRTKPERRIGPIDRDTTRGARERSGGLLGTNNRSERKNYRGNAANERFPAAVCFSQPHGRAFAV